MAINTPKPISRDERYLSKIGGNEEVIVPKPVSREEKYMYRVAGYDDQPIPDYPIGRNEKYWAKIVENGGGEGSTLIEKSITENGTYNASDDEADGYSKVTVNVESENNAKVISTPSDFVLKTNLESIDIPYGVTSISMGAFSEYAALRTVTFPQSLKNIASYAFASSGLTGTIEIPSSVTTIGKSVFASTNVSTIIIHNSEGSITGAPWGATNAQVIWDS